jgi:hypothetical protein
MEGPDVQLESWTIEQTQDAGSDNLSEVSVPRPGCNPPLPAFRFLLALPPTPDIPSQV